MKSPYKTKPHSPETILTSIRFTAMRKETAPSVIRRTLGQVSSPKATSRQLLNSVSAASSTTPWPWASSVWPTSAPGLGSWRPTACARAGPCIGGLLQPRRSPHVSWRRGPVGMNRNHVACCALLCSVVHVLRCRAAILYCCGLCLCCHVMFCCSVLLCCCVVLCCSVQTRRFTGGTATPVPR